MNKEMHNMTVYINGESVEAQDVKVVTTSDVQVSVLEDCLEVANDKIENTVDYDVLLNV
jgi:hypothetical protein